MKIGGLISLFQGQKTSFCEQIHFNDSKTCVPVHTLLMYIR